MDLLTIKPALASLVTTLVGAGVAVRFQDEPAKYIPQGTMAEVLLSIRSVVAEGQDTHTTVDLTTLGPQPLGQELQHKIEGARLFTLRCECKSLSQETDGTSVTYAERIRDRIVWPSAREALALVDVAFVQALSLADVTRKVDNRMASVAHLDLRMRAVSNQADPVRIGYIEDIDISHTLAGEQE